MILTMPSGIEIHNPTQDDINGLLKLDNSFWNEGCGEASLSRDKPPRLVIHQDKDYGFVVLDLDSHKALIDDKKDRNIIVTLESGGEPFPVSICFFMEYEQAKAILLHYIHTEEILNCSQWYDIHDDFDYDSYWESVEYLEGTKIFNKNNLTRK